MVMEGYGRTSWKNAWRGYLEQWQQLVSQLATRRPLWSRVLEVRHPVRVSVGIDDVLVDREHRAEDEHAVDGGRGGDAGNVEQLCALHHIGDDILVHCRLWGVCTTT